MPSLILIIDDDPNLGPVTTELLVALGYRAMWVESYERGFDALSNPHEIGIVLLDLQLGTQRGETLIEALLAKGIAVPPLLIFSAQPIHELKRASETVKARGILQKPCNAAAINQAIQAASLAA